MPLTVDCVAAERIRCAVPLAKVLSVVSDFTKARAKWDESFKVRRAKARVW